MQFSTFALALALSASMVLSQPIAREPTEYYDGLESRDFEGLEARDIESSLEAREPILGFGKKEPKVDYQQCAVNCANQLAQCKLEHPTLAQNLGACYSQNSQCAIHCRAAMPS